MPQFWSINLPILVIKPHCMYSDGSLPPMGFSHATYHSWSLWVGLGSVRRQVNCHQRWVKTRTKCCACRKLLCTAITTSFTHFLHAEAVKEPEKLSAVACSLVLSLRNYLMFVYGNGYPLHGNYHSFVNVLSV